MEQDVARREFASQMDDFHSAFLGRTVLFLAAFVWLMFVSFEFRGFSRRAFVAVTSFEALCLLAWWLRQHWTAAARHGFVLGAVAWSIGLTWLLGTPLAMLSAIGVAQVAGAMLSPWVALAYTGVMVGGTLASAGMRSFRENSSASRCCCRLCSRCWRCLCHCCGAAA